MGINKTEAWLFFAWIVSLTATGGSLMLSEIWHFVPCELCWYQRIAMYPLVFILGIASFRQQTVIVPYVWPLLAAGGAVSVYHILLQKLPKRSAIAACGPTPCQYDYLNWFGWLTIPMLALTAFLLIGFALWQAGRLSKRAK